MQQQLPSLPVPVVRWIRNHARKNYWRVASWYELDDLIQDGILCGYKCAARYGVPKPRQPGRVVRPRLDEIEEPHFMSLVKTAFYNHIGGLIRSKRQSLDDMSTQFSELYKSGDKNDNSLLERLLPAVIGEQELAVLFTQLPTNIRNAILRHFDPDAKLTRRQRAERWNSFATDAEFEIELRSFFWESEMLA